MKRIMAQHQQAVSLNLLPNLFPSHLTRTRRLSRAKEDSESRKNDQISVVRTTRYRLYFEPKLISFRVNSLT